MGIIILAFLIIAETSAQYFLQKYIKIPNSIYFIVGIALYAVVGAIYYVLLNTGKHLALANSLWNAGTEISVALLGFIFFKQKLTHRQIVGLIITIIGINLLA
jgi:multidrug transporter EmrE-like cation transporter